MEGEVALQSDLNGDQVDAANALRIAGHDTPLIVRKVASPTEVALEMYQEGAWCCELFKNRMVRKKRGGEPEQAKAPSDTTEALITTLNDYRFGV